jgi:hypothetical protein
VDINVAKRKKSTHIVCEMSKCDKRIGTRQRVADTKAAMWLSKDEYAYDVKSGQVPIGK